MYYVLILTDMQSGFSIYLKITKELYCKLLSCISTLNSKCYLLLVYIHINLYIKITKCLHPKYMSARVWIVKDFCPRWRPSVTLALTCC